MCRPSGEGDYSRTRGIRCSTIGGCPVQSGAKSSDADPLARYREMLVEKHHTASQDYDKLIVTLAGGSLGLSVTFIHDIAPDPRQKWVVMVAWALLALSLICILWSLITSSYTIRQLIDEIDAKNASYQGSGSATFTLALNIAAGATLVLGLSFLAVFAFVNL